MNDNFIKKDVKFLFLGQIHDIVLYNILDLRIVNMI